MSAASIASRLGRYIAATASTPLAAAVREKAATCLLDGIALGMAAGAEPTTRALLASPFLSIGADGCLVWPSGGRAPLSEAVLLNSYATHARFQDDTDMTAWSHPGSLVIPAALSVAEVVDGTLERALRGIVCGYSVLNWLGADEKVGHAVVERSFRGSPTLGPVAAAAAAAAVLDLPAHQATNAVVIAAANAGGLIDTVGSGSSDWRFQNGSATWRGVLAAVLAKQGIDGAQEVFESPTGFVHAFAGIDPPPALASDPSPESILTVWAKPYPALGDNMAVLAAAVALKQDADIDPSSISGIRAHLNAEFASYPGTSYRGPYTKPTQAIASTAFGVAAALSRGTITFDLYSSALEDPVILALVKKVSISPEPGYRYLDGKVVVQKTEGGEVVCEAAQLPKELFYRNAETATAAFEATLREVGIPGDAKSFASTLIERVARGDTEITAADLLSTAMDLRNAVV